MVGEVEVELVLAGRCGRVDLGGGGELGGVGIRIVSFRLRGDVNSGGRAVLKLNGLEEVVIVGGEGTECAGTA